MRYWVGGWVGEWVGGWVGGWVRTCLSILSRRSARRASSGWYLGGWVGWEEEEGV